MPAFNRVNLCGTVANPNPFLCALCASVVNFSLRKVLVQHRDNRLREGRQSRLRTRHLLVRIHRRDQPDQGPVRPLAGERVPEVVELQLPGVGQHPVPLRESTKS